MARARLARRDRGLDPDLLGRPLIAGRRPVASPRAPAIPPPALDIERRADRAWPAEERIAVGAWALRATHGVTNRANSVFTAPATPTATPGETGDPVGAMIHAAEAFYARRGLPAIFHLSPATWPARLDGVLARRGYLVDQPSEVWSADAGHVAARTGGADPDPAYRPPAPEIVVHERADRAWLDCAYAESPARRAIHEAIVGRIASPCAFVSVRAAGAVIATGLGVADTGWVGVYSMRTEPEHRGRGLARAVLHRLATWAAGRGDRALYLQVLGANAPARRLYAASGLARAYAYHYRHRPGGGNSR